MIRFVHCVRRREDVSLEDFRLFWKGQELNRLLEELALNTGAVRWSTSLTLNIEANLQLMAERDSTEPFDAMVEIWWERARGLYELMQQPEFEELRAAIETCQQPYVDFRRSRRFFTDCDEPEAAAEF
ncbi:MAG: hypothetical protein P8106_02065 [Gammaproteobacteria bacterium]